MKFEHHQKPIADTEFKLNSLITSIENLSIDMTKQFDSLLNIQENIRISIKTIIETTEELNRCFK